MPGDANGDGAVNEDDAAILADHWGDTGANWTWGDFNDSGTVDVADAAILAANWGASLGEAVQGVPEPGTLTMLGCVALGLLLRRRARR
jgi:hypothetical protein